MPTTRVNPAATAKANGHRQERGPLRRRSDPASPAPCAGNGSGAENHRLLRQPHPRRARRGADRLSASGRQVFRTKHVADQMPSVPGSAQLRHRVSRRRRPPRQATPSTSPSASWKAAPPLPNFVERILIDMSTLHFNLYNQRVPDIEAAAEAIFRSPTLALPGIEQRPQPGQRSPREPGRSATRTVPIGQFIEARRSPRSCRPSISRKRDRLTQFFGQAFDRKVHCGGNLLLASTASGVSPSLGSFDRPAIARPPRPGSRRSSIGDQRVAPQLHQRLLGGVDRDAVQPGVEGAVAAELQASPDRRG